jgi:hypothetical protein
MKRKLYSIILILFLGILLSCNKENFNYPDGFIGSSKITVYPILTLKGERYMTVVTGAAFTDPGATAKEGATDIPVKVAGQVDVATPGVYTLVYSSVNKDGFSASASRTVVVATISPDAAANDFSGNYARTSNGQIATWTKIAPGIYTVFNPGGAIGATLMVVAVNAQGDQIDIPEQAASDGSPTSSTDEVYNKSASPPQYSWKIVNPGYGPALRTFIKQ